MTVLSDQDDGSVIVLYSGCCVKLS